MPIIGRPQGPNKFADIALNKAPTANGQDESVGNAVDRLGLGQREASIIKDGKNHNKMGKEEFLKLLAFQLQNQDPMNPMDQNKFAGELAQFSQLEQLANMRTAIEGSTKNDAVEEKFLGASFLGKRVLTEGGGIELKNDGAPVEMNFHLDERAHQVMVRVMDQKGGIVSEIRQENVLPGNHELPWDGKQFDGYAASAGRYNFQVLAFDELNRPVKATTKAAGNVTSVSFENGEVILTVDGSKKVGLKNIDRIEMPEGGGSTNIPVPHLGGQASAFKAPVAAGKPMNSVLDQLNAGAPPAQLETQRPAVSRMQAQKAYEAQNNGLVDYSE